MITELLGVRVSDSAQSLVRRSTLFACVLREKGSLRGSESFDPTLLRSMHDVCGSLYGPKLRHVTQHLDWAHVRAGKLVPWERQRPATATNDSLPEPVHPIKVAASFRRYPRALLSNCRAPRSVARCPAGGRGNSKVGPQDFDLFLDDLLQLPCIGFAPTTHKNRAQKR